VLVVYKVTMTSFYYIFTCTWYNIEVSLRITIIVIVDFIFR